MDSADGPMKPSMTNQLPINCEIDTKNVAQEVHLALATGKTTIKVGY